MRPPEARWWGGVLRWLTPEAGWSTATLMALLLIIVARAMESSRWVMEMPSLSRLILLSLATAYLFSKLRLPGLLLHPLALGVGVAAVLWEVGQLLPPAGLGERTLEVVDRLRWWGEAARIGAISLDAIPFAAILAAIIWMAGYLSGWLAFRGWGWLAVVPGGTLLLISLNYTAEHFGIYFFFYLLVALVVVARLNFVRQRRGWRGAGVRQGSGVALSFVTEGFVFGLVALLVLWQLPIARPATPVEQEWTRFSSPWDRFQSEFNRVFAATSTLKLMPMHNFGDTLPFRGTIALGSQVSLLVASPYPGYWRAKSYDVYTSQGWRSSPVEAQAVAGSEPVPGGGDYAERVILTQRVTLGFDTDLIFAAGQPVSVDLPARALIPVSLDLGEGGGELPPYLRQVAGELAGGGNVSPELVAEVQALYGQLFPTEAVELRAGRRLRVGQSYEVTSVVSGANTEALRSAGTDYPAWVTARYLQLPDSLPLRVRALAWRLTRGLDNPYDKALAIADYLRQIPYTLEIEPPPYDRDAVDYFLFVQRKGYSDYFGSAMTVLLRAAGVPARLAAGYASGEWDPDAEHFVVREKDAHAWAEVFFPGYGWIDFEPTPSLPQRPRAVEPPPPAEEDILDFVDEFFEEDEFLDGGFILGGTPARGGGLPLPLAIAGGGVLLAGLAGWRAWRWGLSRLDPPSQVYEKTRRLAMLTRLGPRPDHTPGEFGRSLAQRLPGAVASIQAIVTAYEVARYGHRQPTPGQVASLEVAWRQLRRALLRRLIPQRR